MNVLSLKPQIDASTIAPERLAGNPALTKEQKIAEASRQFESILLKQILENTQKTVIQSKYADNSTASSIYKEMVTDQLANSISKSGAFGLAKTFEQQLSPPAPASKAGNNAVSHASPTSQPKTAPRPEVVRHKIDSANHHSVAPILNTNTHE